jgi:hypothetical protein
VNPDLVEGVDLVNREGLGPEAPAVDELDLGRDPSSDPAYERGSASSSPEGGHDDPSPEYGTQSQDTLPGADPFGSTSASPVGEGARTSSGPVPAGNAVDPGLRPQRDEVDSREDVEDLSDLSADEAKELKHWSKFPELDP